MSVEKEITGLAEDMVRFRSTKKNPGEIERCLKYIEEYFSDDDFVIKRYEKEGTPSMVISFEDTKEPELVLHGHIDVVPGSDDLYEPEIRDGKMYGRGTADMKAGVACLMKLLKDLRQEEPSVALMIVADEETGGFKGAKYLFSEIGYQPEFAVSAEPNNMERYMDIVIKQKGVMRAEITAEGKNAHGSRPWDGGNAAEKLIEKYPEIREFFPENEEKTWDTTVNLGVLDSGEAVNQVPDEATAKLDIRYSENYVPEEITEDLEKVRGVKVVVSSKEPMLNNDPEDESIQRLKDKVEAVTGKCKLAKKEPASDMRHLTREGIPAVVFGPEGYNVHSPDEHANVESFGDYYEIMKRFILETHR